MTNILQNFSSAFADESGNADPESAARFLSDVPAETINALSSVLERSLIVNFYPRVGDSQSTDGFLFFDLILPFIDRQSSYSLGWNIDEVIHFFKEVPAEKIIYFSQFISERVYQSTIHQDLQVILAGGIGIWINMFVHGYPQAKMYYDHLNADYTFPTDYNFAYIGPPDTQQGTKWSCTEVTNFFKLVPIDNLIECERFLTGQQIIKHMPSPTTMTPDESIGLKTRNTTGSLIYNIVNGSRTDRSNKGDGLGLPTFDVIKLFSNVNMGKLLRIIQDSNSLQTEVGDFGYITITSLLGGSLNQHQTPSEDGAVADALHGHLTGPLPADG